MSREKQYDAAVVIGRFQPLHAAHLKLLEKAQEIAKQVIVVLGGHRCAVTIRDPWTSAERERMVRLGSSPGASHSTFPVCLAARDHLYNDGLWLAGVQQKVRDVIDDNGKVALVGHYKDRTSYYLKMFPQWNFEEVPSFYKGTNATEIRSSYFKGTDLWQAQCPPSVTAFMKDWQDTETYARLREEFEFVEKYKTSWASAPFPPTFVTVDAVVIGSGHVLVVKRRATPGKGMIALPGGFIQQHERIQDAMLRELKEETGIQVPTDQLRSYVVDQGVFDHPDRSLRGRTVTHAFLLRLPDGLLPKVKGDDDAEHAWWMPLGDLYLQEERFFEDHIHIVNFFANKL